MKKYRVPVVVTIVERGWIEVDAPNEEEAEETAEDSELDLVQEREMSWWDICVDGDRETVVVQNEELEP